MKHTLEEAKLRLKIPNFTDEELHRIKEQNPLDEYLPKRGIEVIGSGDKQRALCPFHDDSNPSLVINVSDHYAHCFSCGESADVFKLEQHRTGVDFPTAVRQLSGRSEGTTLATHRPLTARKARKVRKVRKEKPRPTPPFDLRDGTQAERQAIADSRGISYQSVAIAQQFGYLRVATVCGFPSWTLTDPCGRVFESRRIDGEWYPAAGNNGTRKSHTNGRKHWPIGVESLATYAPKKTTALVVEGGPAFLEMWHFLELALSRTRHPGGPATMVPVAVLGSTKNIHPDALAFFKGMCVRVYPDADYDDDGRPKDTGRAAAKEWIKLLLDAGATDVDWFDFRGGYREDGKPVKDIGDLLSICSDQKYLLKGLLP